MSVSSLLSSFYILKNILGVDEDFIREIDGLLDKYGVDLYEELANFIYLISFLYLLARLIRLVTRYGGRNKNK